jgi:hypothetical protein
VAVDPDVQADRLVGMQSGMAHAVGDELTGEQARDVFGFWGQESVEGSDRGAGPSGCLGRRGESETNQILYDGDPLGLVLPAFAKAKPIPVCPDRRLR